ncbi:MAG: glycosyltransferase family 2 protein [bacterium]
MINSARQSPPVSVIVLNYNGLTFLPRCIETLRATRHEPLEIIIADNASKDGSLEYLRKNFPEIKTVAFDTNWGYSGAYNRVAASAEGEFLVFLNFDVEVDPDWLGQPLELFEKDARLGACQPKLRALRDRNRFEYAGACGGFLDLYGYPFARGRVFDILEMDTGQYEDARECFWASGAALFVRKSAFLQVGGLDDSFFLHMEEIDFCWRLHLNGWKVCVAPRSIVYHYSGAALSSERFLKIYYNQRNSLMMLLKNYGIGRLLPAFGGRLLFDIVTFFSSPLRREPKRSVAVVAAYLWILSRLWLLLKKRRQVQRQRSLSDREALKSVLPKSLVIAYFLKKKRTFRDLVPSGW